MFTNIKLERKAQGLSVQQLADKCSELGYPIARRVLSKMENGERSNISLPELLVISESLRLAPLQLIYSPYDIGTQVEWIPGQMTTGQAASEHFMRSRWGGPDVPNTSRVSGLISLMNLRANEALTAMHSLERLPPGSSDTLVRMYDAEIQDSAKEFIRLRNSLVHEGVELPSIPPKLDEIARWAQDQVRNDAEDES
ncbi:helix-turn-helix domain-containing protein [Brevibacterium casei]|uniref:helix-turn-helix domain-containing protein n=1 Tax=Brevibacterium casei TaxID=33889 RepID=UPI003F49671F